MSVNVDGVVFGIRRLAQVMPEGGRIVATASLAGLTGMPSDPVYAASKHAVVGFVRSVAPTSARRGISVNAVCPGIADTAMVAEDARVFFQASGFPLLQPADVADAVWLALTSGETGHAWGVQPGLAPFDFRFPNLPGARTADGTGGRAAAADTLSGVESGTPHGENFVLIQHKRTCAWHVRLRRGGVEFVLIQHKLRRRPPGESPRRLPRQENCLVRRTASSRRPHSS